MKTIGKLKLNQLAKAELEKREMNSLRGGEGCGCGCIFKDDGGASTDDNALANYKGGYITPGCGNVGCYEIHWSDGKYWPANPFETVHSY